MPRKIKTAKEQLADLMRKMTPLLMQENERKTPIGIGIVDVIEEILDQEITQNDVAVVKNFLIEQEEKDSCFSNFMNANVHVKKNPVVQDKPLQGHTDNAVLTSKS